ncbi:flavin reductase [Lampropedia cohaerens]|uniref:Flavin reductase n=1 Tax=Lampropedia cohaerens TaxID=1610491 RepID=A0A0U1Q3N0_9BURK|nr:flavin reductase [Lampropedia cohaerens]KKW69330.1 flavin reductase [Lampropedia cohaerens]
MIPAPVSDTGVSQQQFRSALALLTGAVTLITTDGEAGRAGFTASAVCSVCDTPPTILVCMRTAAWSNPMFRRNGVLCVNVLNAQQQPFSACFSDPALSQQERFAQAEWDTLVSGAPVLRHALVSLDCAIEHTHTVGTHDVCFCRVLDIRAEPDGEALAYFNRNYHQIDHRSVLER